MLRAARQSDDATQAFERLARVYWQPLYQFVCRRGYQPADAQDVVQAFFEFLVEKQPLESADPAKGRFRSFLLGVLRHFMANRRTVQNAQKRGGGQAPVPWDELSPGVQMAAGFTMDCSSDEVFDIDWARTLVGHVLAQLKTEYETAGRANVFARLNPYLSPTGAEAAYAAVGLELAMSEDAVKMAVNRLRRRFRALLRSWIAQSVAAEEDVAIEYRYLATIMSRVRE